MGLYALLIINGFILLLTLCLQTMNPSRFFFYSLPKGEKTFPRGKKHRFVRYFLFFSLFYQELLFPLEKSSHASSSSLLLQ